MAKHCEYSQQIKHLKVSLEEMQEIIDKHRTIKEWAYIIHDKDVYTQKDEEKNPEHKEGTLKKPHIHLYLNFGQGSATFKDVARWFKDEPQYVGKVHGRKADMLLYLTHRNVPEKYQYKDDEVVSNFDLKQAIEEDQKNHSLVNEADKIVFDFMQEKITYAQANKKIKDLKKVCNNKELLRAILTADKTVEQIWKQQCRMSTKGKRNMKIIFIHGDSGSGKSTYAELYAKMLCEKKGYRDFARSSASNDIMQDYMGEDIFILDDYRDVDEMTGKAESLSDTLKMLDPHYASSSKSRYTNKTFMGKLIIITSTKDPLLWFEGTKEQRWQFFRRISLLIDIDKDYVREYQEQNEEKGVPFLCGFKHDGSYIQRAKLKCEFANPVPEYVKLMGKEETDATDMFNDITSYMDELKEAQETA